MTPAVYHLLAECARSKRPDDFLFTRKDGKRVRDFRKAWLNLCEAAGVPNLLVHDLRRSAARNLRRAGVAEGVIMEIGGWKTRSMFDRYNIISQDDIQHALVRLETWRSNMKSDSENGRRFGRREEKMPELDIPPISAEVN